MADTLRHRKVREAPVIKQHDSLNGKQIPMRPKYKAVVFLCLLISLPATALFCFMDIDPSARKSILINLLMSSVGFFLTVRFIPVVATYVIRRNMFGFDINKKGSPGGEIKIPESLGIVVAVVYLVIIILFQHFYFTPDSSWLVEYNAALACICFMTFLGFMDDVLDIPWRIKLILPSVAALPLLMAYAGHTTIVIPKPFRPIFGVDILDLGWIYKVYMGLLVVFCTNSINILAGVNGLETGQTAVIAGAVVAHNIWQIGGLSGIKHPLQEDMQQAHLFSIYLMLPFIATTLGLLSYNWFPSSVFVGDSFTYFAGMTFAVVGILGHFRFDVTNGTLIGSQDMNLLNLFLRIFGKCNEQTICIRLLVFQAFCCGLCFVIRHILTGIYK